MGRQPGLPRLPPVAVPGRRPRRHRRAAHRPRPVAGHELRDGPGGGGRGARRSSTSSASARSRRPPATAACTSTSASSRAGTPTAPARPRSASPARWSGGGPSCITGQWWKEQRGARVFIDFNQNAPHKTVFGAWCVRARVGAQVSTPFRWDELPAIHPDELTLATVPGAARRATATRGPTIDDEPQSIEPLVARYRDDLAARHPRRAVAAGVPEDARRGPPREPEPRPSRLGPGDVEGSSDPSVHPTRGTRWSLRRTEPVCHDPVMQMTARLRSLTRRARGATRSDRQAPPRPRVGGPLRHPVRAPAVRPGPPPAPAPAPVRRLLRLERQHRRRFPTTRSAPPPCGAASPRYGRTTRPTTTRRARPRRRSGPG